MRNLSDTIARLSRIQAPRAPITPATSDRLAPLRDFGTNPGALEGFCFVPKRDEAMPLVVVLHGCTQDAAGFDRGTGWTDLAAAEGFAVLAPQQTRSNNFNLCFNWYERSDNRRGAGEPLSIRQMIAAMIARHPIDPSRVFVTGLSAGGAMNAVMLATYPEIFAGGAIVAGLPYGSANSLPEAFDRMRGHGFPVDRTLSGLVTAASIHPGPWPRVAVWHGAADTIVAAGNAEAILAQWRGVHRVANAPDERVITGDATHRVWRDAGGRAVVEDWRIARMGHGTPLATTGTDACGQVGPYMLDVGLSSTRHIARAWGIDFGKPRLTPTAPNEPVPQRAQPLPGVTMPPQTRIPLAQGAVGQVIDDALRAAGLMR